MISEVLANWTKICVGLASLMVTAAYCTGHITTDDFKVIVGLGLGIHAAVSGLSGLGK